MSVGFRTLLYKEILRFVKVLVQTVGAPVLTALLYLLIFSHALAEHVQVYPGVHYTAFLMPGLILMTALQNAFANASSSLIQSKVTGNIVFVLLPPLSYLEFFLAYLIAALVRGFTVGLGVLLVGLLFADLELRHPMWILAFALASGAVFSCVGIMAGIWANQYDNLAAVQNFIVMPLTFLSGVFYSIHSLSPFWQSVSHLNPVFYMIDGFRYGFFGQADVDPWLGLAVVTPCALLLSGFALMMLKSGYKLRH
ncbi:MAG: ABC transporter permease [Pseudomonadota bacterium]